MCQDRMFLLQIFKNGWDDLLTKFLGGKRKVSVDVNVDFDMEIKRLLFVEANNISHWAPGICGSALIPGGYREMVNSLFYENLFKGRTKLTLQFWRFSGSKSTNEVLAFFAERNLAPAPIHALLQYYISQPDKIMGGEQSFDKIQIAGRYHFLALSRNVTGFRYVHSGWTGNGNEKWEGWWHAAVDKNELQKIKIK